MEHEATARKQEKGSLFEPHFTDKDKAREYLEAMRWPEGPVCPHCGVIGEAGWIVRKEKTKEQVIEMLRAGKHIRKAPRDKYKKALRSTD